MRVHLGLFVALLWVCTPCVVQGQITLRPVDHATVRIIGFSGVAAGRDDSGQVRLAVRGSHGTGVYVDRAGWIATAGHVVDHADYLVVVHPGEDRARPAEIVYVSGEHDLALIRVQGPTSHHLRLDRVRSLSLGQEVSASGYPLDARERWPAAVSGQVGRPLNDGRVQLAMSVNPGNSGGPVITHDGTLVGILSQGANPAAGAQGIAVMEPLAPLVSRLRNLRGGDNAPLPDHSAEADIIMEQVQAREMPGLEERLARMATLATSSQVSAAIFAVEAAGVEHELLEQAGVSNPDALGADQRARFDEVHASTVSWAAMGVRADDDDYSVLSMVGSAETPAPRAVRTARSAAVSRSSSYAVSGPATGPSEWAPVTTVEVEHPSVFSFAFSARPGLVFDDHRNEDTVGGALFGLAAALRMFAANTPYARLALNLGVGVDVGGWRQQVAASVLAELGMRLEVGPRSSAIVVSANYTPGWITASARETSTALGYQVGLGLQFDDLEISASWREVGRLEGTPLRTLLLAATWELRL